MSATVSSQTADTESGPSTPEAAGMSNAVPLDRIEEALTRALHEGKEEGESPVRRSRMSNLVIFCDRIECIEEIQLAIPNIVADHPARVLLTMIDPDQTASILGEVNVWCQLMGGRQRICSEQITFRAKPGHQESLPFAIRGFLTGDLPTNLWWFSLTPPPLAGPFFIDLADQASLIIYDSNGWTEPAKGISVVSGWMANMERGTSTGKRRVVSDLNWRRLKFWRRMLAQALDPNTAPGALDSITEVVVQHGPHAVVQAWELVSFLASRLGWRVGAGRVQPGKEISWQVQAKQGNVHIRIDRLPEGPSEVRRVRIACKVDGKPGAFHFAVEEDRLVVTREGESMAARTITMPKQSLDQLIARQLSDREHDPVFHESMAVAQQFAKSVLGR